MTKFFRLHSFVFFIALICLSYTVRAADFEFAGIDKHGCDKLAKVAICASISLTGRIERGDTQKLQHEVEKIQSALSRTLGVTRVGQIFLESAGGNMVEAMSIGRILRRLQVATHVSAGEVCASACVLILASGVTRMPAGDVIVHSFYAPSLVGSNDFTKTENFYVEMTATVEAYLKEMRVSSRLLEEMIRVPHSTHRRLELDELVKLGLLGVDPVYAQARPTPSPAGADRPKN